MAPRVSIGTPEWRPIESSSETIGVRVAEGGIDVAIRFLQDVPAQSRVIARTRPVARRRTALPAVVRSKARPVRRRLRRGMGRPQRPPRPARRHSARAFRQHRLPVGFERLQAGQAERDRRNVRDFGMCPHRVHAGQRSAARASIDLILPCATGERTTRMCHWPGNEISAAKRPWPVRRGRSSNRGTERPTNFCFRGHGQRQPLNFSVFLLPPRARP